MGHSNWMDGWTESNKKAGQATYYNVTSRRIRASIVTVRKL